MQGISSIELLLLSPTLPLLPLLAAPDFVSSLSRSLPLVPSFLPRTHPASSILFLLLLLLEMVLLFKLLLLLLKAPAHSFGPSHLSLLLLMLLPEKVLLFKLLLLEAPDPSSKLHLVVFSPVFWLLSLSFGAAQMVLLLLLLLLEMVLLFKLLLLLRKAPGFSCELHLVILPVSFGLSYLDLLLLKVVRVQLLLLLLPLVSISLPVQQNKNSCAMSHTDHIQVSMFKVTVFEK